MQAGCRKIQSGDGTLGADPTQGSDQETWMQAYTRRLLLPRYRTHTLWVNAQRSLLPEEVDVAQGSNRSKTHLMRYKPRHREMRTTPLNLAKLCADLPPGL